MTIAIANGVVVDAAGAQPSAACAVCTQAVMQLTTAYNHEKAQLDSSKEANDKKAQKIDKVQKAQTRRWLMEHCSPRRRMWAVQTTHPLQTPPYASHTDRLRLSLRRHSFRKKIV